MRKQLLIFLPLALIPVLFFIKFTEDHKPHFLTSPVSMMTKVTGLNRWQPQTGVLGMQSDLPIITAKTAIFIDTATGQVFYEKNSHQRLPIASLVKVMTVLIALEHKNLNDEYVVSKRAADMEPDKMLLIAGERLTLEELFSGIFLVSANDAAEVLAEGTLSSEEFTSSSEGSDARRARFIKMMNSKASQLGMVDTYYANPTGLDEDENNSYSSAFDLAILTRYLIRNYPKVVDISKTEHIYLPITEKHQDYDMHSGINLLTTYPGVVGFKTGYTPEAGLTLITLARKGGHEIVGVLLGSGDRRDEARELLDYSFAKLGIK